MKSITFDDFKNSIYNAIENRPRTWRKGQACFNFIEYKYHVARKVEFDNDNPVDCFYDDTKIDAFIEQSWKYIKITINELNNIYNK